MFRLAPVVRSAVVAAARPTVRLAQPAFRAFSAEPFLDRKEVTERVMEVIKNFEKVDASKLNPEATFKALDLDSLDAVEVVMAIEEEFCIEIPDSEADKLTGVADTVQYISNHPMAK